MKLRQLRARTLARQQHRSAYHFVRIHNRGLLFVYGHYLGAGFNFKVKPADEMRLEVKPKVSSLDVIPDKFTFKVVMSEVNYDNLRRALLGS